MVNQDNTYWWCFLKLVLDVSEIMDGLAVKKIVRGRISWLFTHGWNGSLFQPFFRSLFHNEKIIQRLWDRFCWKSSWKQLLHYSLGNCIPYSGCLQQRFLFLIQCWKASYNCFIDKSKGRCFNNVFFFPNMLHLKTHLTIFRNIEK